MGAFILFGFILFPVTIIFIVLRIITKDKSYGKAIKLIWLIVLGCITVLLLISYFFSQVDLRQSDIYGEYVIDRTKYSGLQSDWQYNSFRFEITKQNDFLFYKTNKEKILKTYKGKIEIINGYSSPRLLLKYDTLKLNILEQKPTLYRDVWTFDYVFKSPKFGNMFFTKKKWQPIKN